MIPAFPNPSFWRARARGLLLVAGLLLAGAAGAERADRERPTQVEADSLRHDDVRQTTVFTGNVVLTRGTLVIRADRLVMRQDPEGYQHGSAFGNPASFRQKRDGVDQFVHGRAQQLDYDGKAEVVRLIDRAQLKRLEQDRVTDEVHGSLIVYDGRSEQFSVDGGSRGATAENPGGRVRLVIQPRSETGAGAGPSGPAVTLKPATAPAQARP
ncbi:MAG: lipopolysaccharide transport periplasmic protein LptA [Betaproteobacteria bacterium]|nr:lipopolysaccharide transport periplasmic protein LptA [Betaproteobacteria bacterium]